MVKWKVPPLWDGGTCWIIGGGPSMPRQFNIPEDIINGVMTGKLSESAYSPYLSSIHDKHVIGVNNAYRIGDWIDILFFGDCGWYLVHRNALAKFPGLKVTCCMRFANRGEKEMEGIKYLRKDNTARDGISNDLSMVCWNANSGAASISLAIHLGVKRIILLGFDMNLDSNKFSHWHGSHNRKEPQKKKVIPPFARHLRGFPTIAAQAEKRGVEIIQTNPNSAIKCFKVVPVAELLADSKTIQG
jgi:hypothetical protein